MELVDLTKILKPGDKVYSAIHGRDCTIKDCSHIDSISYPIWTDLGSILTKFGQLYNLEKDGEPVIFPSKNQRDWSKYVKEKESEALLEEANRRYPIGTRFISANKTTGKIRISTSIPTLMWKNEIRVDIAPNSDLYSTATIYNGVKWAEIIEPLFTTEDEVDVWEKTQQIWFVSSAIPHQIQGPYPASELTPHRHSECTYFSSYKTAQEWIDKNKPKSSVFSPKQVEEIIRLIKENK